MSNIRLTLSLTALAVLAACTTESKVAPAPAPVVVQPAPAAGAVVVPSAPIVTTPTQSAPIVTVPTPSAPSAVVVPSTGSSAVVVTPAAAQPLRAGTGRLESMVDLPPAAAAGSSVPGANKRVGIRMDDGSLQYLDTAANDLAIGDRVAITSDGYMRHPVP
jgi:hypothetical protein